jgi:hypothetical protein
LLREREHFAGIDGFAILDFVGAGGAIIEDVLAFSRNSGTATTIVVFNNRSAPAHGVLRLDRDLGISAGAGRFCTFRDRLSKKHFLRAAPSIHDRGLELELGSYQSAVLVDFQEIYDSEGHHARLQQCLGLSGVSSLDEAGRQIHLEDAREAFGGLLATLSVAAPMSAPAKLAMEEQQKQLDRQLQRVFGSREAGVDGENQAGDLAGWLEAISRLAAVEQALGWPRTARMLAALERLLLGVEKRADAPFVLPAFALLGTLHRRWGSRALRELEPGKAAARVLTQRRVGKERARQLVGLIETAAAGNWLETTPPPGRTEASKLLTDARENEISTTLVDHDRKRDSLAGDHLERFFAWRATAAALGWLASPIAPDIVEARPFPDRADAVVGWCDVLERLYHTLKRSDFKIEPVLKRLRGE